MFPRSVYYVVFSAVIMGPGLLLAKPAGRGVPPEGPPPELILKIFQQADANNDGSVTKAQFTAAMQNLARGGRPERGGPPPQGNQPVEQRGPSGHPPHGGGEREHPPGHHGPPPKPGQVLPEPIAEILSLNEKQTRQIAALQAEVDKRLAAILTDEQREQFENARPPHGPGHPEGEQGDRPTDRPQRPQRPE